MSEYDDLVEGYEEGQKVIGPPFVPEMDEKEPVAMLAPLTDEEHQAMMESLEPATALAAEPLTATAILASQHELRPLRPDQVPVVGQHYVIYDGRPMPVVRGAYKISEDEHVRTQLGGMEGLKDADGQRVPRAERTLRMRYRGYLCGEMSGL